MEPAHDHGQCEHRHADAVPDESDAANGTETAEHRKAVRAAYLEDRAVTED